MAAELPKVFEHSTSGIVFSRNPDIHSSPSLHGKSPPRLRCLRRLCLQSIALSGWCKRTDGIEAAQPAPDLRDTPYGKPVTRDRRGW